MNFSSIYSISYIEVTTLKNKGSFWPLVIIQWIIFLMEKLYYLKRKGTTTLL